MREFISDYDQNFQILTPNDGAHYFFGYYDMRATGENGKHLCHRVSFWDHIPLKDDVCELGYLDEGRFYPFAKTTAWNFQQGAMLQYHPFFKDTVYYNVCEDERFKTVTHDLTTGVKKYTQRATACISPDGRWGLAVHFGRIFAFRPGYGYAGCRDLFERVNAPAEDGVFLVDMNTGNDVQICSYRDLLSLAGFDAEDKILINHITFNTASDRFVMLVRSFPQAGKMWLTSMVVCDLAGNCKILLPKTYVSHYNWTSPTRILAHCTVQGEKKSMYEIDVESGEWREYDMPYFHEPWHNPDIHCNISPDGKYIIGDGYELDRGKGRESYRALMAYSIDTGISRELLRVKSYTPNGIGDIRTDLHARFVFGGRFISFDTTQNNCRQIAMIDTSALNF